MNNNLTNHAKNRMQQRNIPQIVIDWLVDYGNSEYAGEGARKYFFDKQSRKNFKKYAGKIYGTLEQHLNAYVIVASDNSIVTVGIRYEPIRQY